MDEIWRPMPGDLVGLAEIRRRINRSSQRTVRLTNRPDFPAPVAVLGTGRIWYAPDIEKWIQDYRPDLAG
jgi:prophage regulatory protein